MPEITIELTGLEDLLQELSAFPAALQQNVVRGMVATGASTIRQEILRRAPVLTGPVSEGHPPAGTLKRAIYQARLPSQCTPTLEVFKVGVRQGKKAQTSKRGKSVVNLDAFYASWVEYGHYTRVPHAMTKTAKAAGRVLGVAKYVPARPFFRPGVDAASGAAVKAMADYLQRKLPVAVEANRILTTNGH